MQKSEQGRETAAAVVVLSLFCNFNLISMKGDWKKKMNKYLKKKCKLQSSTRTKIKCKYDSILIN